MLRDFFILHTLWASWREIQWVPLYTFFYLLGTDFVMYDNGADPDLLPSEVLDDISRKVVCKITYESNIAGKKPNAMQVTIPATVCLLLW